METKKGILIDSVNKTVTEVEIDGSKTLKEMYRLIGCECVDCNQITSKNDLWIDDNGIIFADCNTRGFRYGDNHFLGNGLVLGFNRNNGNSCDTTLTLEQVTNSVHFLDDKETKRFLDFIGI
jgi:hypothetical protein